MLLDSKEKTVAKETSHHFLPVAWGVYSLSRDQLLENLLFTSSIFTFSSGLTSFQGVGLLFVQTTVGPRARRVKYHAAPPTVRPITA